MSSEVALFLVVPEAVVYVPTEQPSRRGSFSKEDVGPFRDGDVHRIGLRGEYDECL